jgi:internalin A
MKSISWLHLTDLHYGMTGQSHLWPNIREHFFDDLAKMHDKTGPWSFVCFTGGLVQRGSEEEFKRLNDLLASIWERYRALGSNPVLLPVPGNHDLQRPDAKIPSVRLLAKWSDNPEIHEEFWEDKNSEYRMIVQDAFANYCRWFDECELIPKDGLYNGLLPGDYSVYLEENGTRLGVVGLNTTFLQLTPGPFKNRLAWNQRQLQSACRGDAPTWLAQNDFSILLTHQGPDWLNSDSREKEMGEISPAGRFLIHLFGHMHEPDIRCEGIGGGPARRLWQGKALFGLEEFGEQKKKRQHGYGVGMFQQTDNGAPELRMWPRAARYHSSNGWQLVPDHETYSLESDEGTRSERLEEFIAKNLTRPRHDKFTDSTRLSNPHAVTQNHRTWLTLPCNSSPLETDIHPWQWPYDDPTLRAYCASVCQAHSHIRFVEIPYLKDVSDVELDNLYVNPLFSRQEIHPDVSPLRWPLRIQAIEALKKFRRLVLLGDPGSGKSTLVSCLSWQLCRPKPLADNEWTKELWGCIPLPMILREFRLKSDLTWEGLLDAFVEHRIGKLLRTRQTVESLLRDGRAIVLLDGVDEIGNMNIRRKLRDAVHTGIAAYQNSRWILTSRIVGYDRVPFHFRIEELSSGSVTDAEVVEHTKRTKRVRTIMAESLYLAPFDDAQIRHFSVNWYSQHENDKQTVDYNAESFVRAIRENEGTQRLGRIPYLLTLMALIHHKNVRLPHGRTELYDRIATAYLESIDLRRQLDQLPYSLAQKRRWLAEIAYRMQLRRAKKSWVSNQGEILVSKNEVQAWIRDAMADSGTQDSKDESEALLEYFAQRSGLLLPRGEGKFCFMHLSLQEYFAACFLEPRLTVGRFFGKKPKLTPSDKQLRDWVNSEAWLETFVLLFELLSEKSTAETEGFLRHLFGSRFDREAKRGESTATDLLAELATDPFVLLTAETRRKMRQQCWRWTLGRKRYRYRYRNKIVRTLVRESDGDIEKAWEMASIATTELKKVEALDLSGCSNLSDLRPLAKLPNLTELILNDCNALCDLTPLARLTQLKFLALQGCSAATSIEPIAALSNLKSLILGAQADLSPLSGLKFLSELHLHYDNGMKETDLSPLAKMRQLRFLCAVPLSRRTRSESTIMITEELRQNPNKILSRGLRRLVLHSESRIKSSLIEKTPTRRRKRD